MFLHATSHTTEPIGPRFGSPSDCLEHIRGWTRLPLAERDRLIAQLLERLAERDESSP